MGLETRLFLADVLPLVVALSILLNPGPFIFHERFLSNKDLGGEKESILIAGYGRILGIINQISRGFGLQITDLDYNYKQLDIRRKLNFRPHVGDATRPDSFHSGGIEKAKLFVVALDDKEKITELVKYSSHNYPQVHVIATVLDHHHVYDLYGAKCRDIFRDYFDFSARAVRSALEAPLPPVILVKDPLLLSFANRISFLPPEVSTVLPSVYPPTKIEPELFTTMELNTSKAPDPLVILVCPN